MQLMDPTTLRANFQRGASQSLNHKYTVPSNVPSGVMKSWLDYATLTLGPIMEHYIGNENTILISDVLP